MTAVTGLWVQALEGLCLGSGPMLVKRLGKDLHLSQHPFLTQWAGCCRSWLQLHLRILVTSGDIDELGKSTLPSIQTCACLSHAALDCIGMAVQPGDCCGWGLRCWAFTERTPKVQPGSR